MADPDDTGGWKTEEFLEKINSLEKRLTAVEKELKKHGYPSIHADPEEMLTETSSTLPQPPDDNEDEEIIEGKIGEYGLAWLGTIVLLFGITFLLQYLQNTGATILSSLLGYILVVTVFIVSFLMRKFFPYLAYMFRIISVILLYYVTARLHFFSASPVLSGIHITLLLLLVLNVSQVFITIREKSETYGIISLVFLSVTGILSDNPHVILPLTALTTIVSVFYFFHYKWSRLLLFSLFLVYLTFLCWLMSNPFMGHSLQLTASHQYSYIYLFGIVAIFSLITLIKKDALPAGQTILPELIFNGLGFSFMILLLVLAFFSNYYNWMFLSISAYCFAFSIFLKYRSEWKFTPALFALYSFVSLSIALYGMYKLPGAYFLLSIESLLVISIAIWFRSRIIVVMNMILFLGLLAAYLFSANELDGVNFSFAAAALISAGILNWKKERLEIKTDWFRNLYLIATFFMVLFALFEAVPVKYVALSWIVAALFYFLLNLMLRNIKYRWMAIFTFIAAALHLFIVDLARIEMVYRILAFLVLAVISIIISIVYSRRIKKNGQGGI